MKKKKHVFDLTSLFITTYLIPAVQLSIYKGTLSERHWNF